MSEKRKARFLFGLLFLGLAQLAFAGEIESCKYLVVTDFISDPYGIAKELRAQARTRGFTVISSASEVPAPEQLKACVLSGSWSATGFGGDISVRVVDVTSGVLMGEAATHGTNWWGVGRTVRAAVSKLFNQLGYRGYDETAYQEHIQRTYPPRPQMRLTEQEIRVAGVHSPIEGIWTDPQNEYRLGIVKAPEGTKADYVAVVLESNSPIWHSGEVKAEIRATAASTVFTSTYFLANKSATGTTFTLDHGSILRGSVALPRGTTELLFLRVWPKVPNDEPSANPSGGIVKTGTGFLVSRTGLIATNWHVVSGANRVTVVFPTWNNDATAEVLLRDTANDLAVLRVEATRLSETCRQPFQVSSARAVSLGQHVSTIGYPLSPILGSSPKFSEGVIASKTGLKDDPTSFQISAAVQPGSSGSPLLDGDGNVIGVVVATIDAAAVYQATSSLPQNINWAIKSDYLLNLMAMLPTDQVSQRSTPFSPDAASGCVALIRVW